MAFNTSLKTIVEVDPFYDAEASIARRSVGHNAPLLHGLHSQ